MMAIDLHRAAFSADKPFDDARAPMEPQRCCLKGVVGKRKAGLTMTKQDTTKHQVALKRLNELQHDAAGTPRRRFQRFPVRSQAALCPGDLQNLNQPSNTVQLRDISRGGAGLLSGSPATIGQFWQLQIMHDNVGIATLPAFCRYCHHVDDGMYLIGVEFGVQASILVALGVNPRELADGDEPESSKPLLGDFVEPELLLNDTVEA
jgi:hypothetical protein